ncbi:peptide ABC transporter substrate-binding protein [Demequina flava]|uniref:peptide ABC transporter substrate-binding protein n=1 Tax=Demequina flava TaxID=1095025 RepID=UPI000782D391|nr:ABC transporter substrate-binding protein [Demequina flava]
MARSIMKGLAFAATAATALSLAACSDGASDSDASSSDQAGSTDPVIITANGTEPLYPLVTTEIQESGSGKIMTALFAGLVSYNADGSIEMDVAESIESDDNITWTVTLKDGQKFTNGEAVTSDSFVDAWQYGALLSNAQGGAYFFDNIVGYSDSEDSELTGLTVVDDLTFEVELTAPQSDWPLRLGYTAYMPMPSVAYEDIAAYGENPIGNGPYMLEGEGAWLHNEQIALVANPDYTGVRQAQNDGLTFVFYGSADAAYADAQAGNLDVLDEIPDNALATFESDFEARSVNQAAAINQGLNIPFYLDHWSGEEGELRRAAISMAINREEITETIFDGTRSPATDFTSPVVDGWSDSLAGAEVLDYDAEAAQALWAEADAIAPYDETFTIDYNSDAPHQIWVDAVANSISNVLGIEAQGNPYPSFSASLEPRVGGTLTGATRAGWQADYPSLANFIAPLFGSTSTYNFEGYASDEMDAALDAAANAESLEQSIELYQDAEEILMADLPMIPLWYQNVVGVWSETVDNVDFGWDSAPLYYEITGTES